MPKFEGIKSRLFLKLYINFPKDVDNLREVDIENSYFKTLYNEKFNTIILQSEFQSKIMYFNSKIFS